jgi:Phosphoesterase family.
MPTPLVTPAVTPIPSPAATSVTHVVIVWLENAEYSDVSASSMPYLTGLAATYGNATQYFAVSHPSEPNYLAFWSGSTQGATDDGTYNVAGASLSSQFAARGLSWRTYAQDYPTTAGCHTGSSYSGPVDGWGVAGDYARKHVPAMSFTSVSGTAECNKIQPLAAFNPLVNFAFVVPNLCNDAHGPAVGPSPCDLGTADAFLKAFSPQVFNSPDWAHTLYIVTFDEGTSGSGGGGQVYTMVARAGLSHLSSSATHNHYGLTRTIENIFGLPCMNNACSAVPLTEFLP